MSAQVRVREGLKLFPVRLLAAGGAKEPTAVGGQRTVREKKKSLKQCGLPVTQLVETKKGDDQPEP